jgi:DNA-binding NarL/FixJ family response regulator
LPDTNGTEIVKQMRQRLPTARIIVTGWYDSSFIFETVQSAGADGFILKNKLRNELLALWEVPPE